MATVHGKNTKVYLNGYDVSPSFTGYEISINVETPEDTAFGDSSRTRKGGIKSGSFSLEGWYDTVSPGSDAVMAPAIGVGNDILTILPEGDVASLFGYSIKAHQGIYTPGAKNEGLVAVNAEFQATEDIGRVKVYHALAARTVTGATSSVDDVGAATTRGGLSFMHVTDSTALTSFDVAIEESATGSFGGEENTNASFTQVTASPAKEMISLASAVKRYLRIKYTLVGTSVTFWVGNYRA